MSWPRNLDFMLCVQTYFCSSHLACFDSLKCDVILLLLDVWWCYWYLWFQFLGMWKFRCIDDDKWILLLLNIALPRKFSWLCLFIADWYGLYQYYVVCLVVEFCCDDDEHKLPYWLCPAVWSLMNMLRESMWMMNAAVV